MRINNILLYTVCALALLGTCNMTYAMEDFDSKEVSRVKTPALADAQLEGEARQHATQLGIPIQAEAQITVDLATAYRTASLVHRYFKAIFKIGGPESATWTELVQNAAQGKYSPFFQSVIHGVGELEKFGDIPTEEFRGIARDYKSYLSSAKQSTPQEAGEHLDNFSNNLTVSQGFLSSKLALDEFVTGLLAEFRVDLEEERSMVKLPEDLSALKALLSEKKGNFSHHMVPLVQFFSEMAVAEGLEHELGVLSRHLPLASLVQQKGSLKLVAYTVRDYVYATFLLQQEGKDAGEVLAAKKTLLQNAGFKALYEETKDQPPFTGLNLTHDMPLSDLLRETREEFEKTNQRLIEEVKLMASLKRVAQAKSEELGALYNESLRKVGESYKEIAWINALTLGIEDLPR